MKVVAVGDAGVGKTCFLRSWISKSFPTDSLRPTVFEDFTNEALVDGTHLNVNVWDTGEITSYRM